MYPPATALEEKEKRESINDFLSSLFALKGAFQERAVIMHSNYIAITIS